jgi:hypothetical protein
MRERKEALRLGDDAATAALWTANPMRLWFDAQQQDDER